MTLDEKWIEARGIRAATAAEILSWHGEAKLWQRIFKSGDDSIVLRGLMYLTDRRDGKPAQQINVTSQNITIAASDLERARAIVAEIRGERSPIIGLPQHAESQASPGDLSSTDVRPVIDGDRSENETKLCFGTTMGQEKVVGG